MTGHPLRVAGPGLYDNLTDAQYHADPAPGPSLSCSLAAKLITETAKSAWYRHPRLNPGFEEEDEKKFDLGTTAHALLLGKGAELHIIDADDWRKTEAKKERAEAIEAGKQPVLLKLYEKASAMAEAAREQLADDPENYDAFTDGKPEIAAVWQDGGVWCRSQIDWLMNDRRRIYDYKTFAGERGADPEAFVDHIVRQGKDIQDPFYSRGVAALELGDPMAWFEISFRFVVQDPKPPHLLSVVELPSQAREWSMERVEWAIGRWHDCMAADRWPGFAPHTYVVGVPAWAQMKWEERRRGIELADAVAVKVAEAAE